MNTQCDVCWIDCFNLNFKHYFVPKNKCISSWRSFKIYCQIYLALTQVGIVFEVRRLSPELDLDILGVSSFSTYLIKQTSLIVTWEANKISIIPIWRPSSPPPLLNHWWVTTVDWTTFCNCPICQTAPRLTESKLQKWVKKPKKHLFFFL